MLIKKTFVLIFSSLLSLNVFAETKATDVLGFWLSEEGRAVIEVTQVGDKFQGKLVWLKVIADGEVKDKLDENNPDESLRSRSLQGLINLKDFVFDGDDEWEDGTIYDPKSGKTYSAKMELEDQNTLEIRGFVGISLFGRTTTWKRQKGPKPD